MALEWPGERLPVRFVEFAQQAVARGASDLILSAGSPPVMRRARQISRLADARMSPGDLEAIVNALLTDSHRQQLNQCGEVEFSHGILGTGRFRVSVHYQRGSLAVVARVIPSAVPHPTELGLPDEALCLTRAVAGLILVAGGASSGRSTTLAAMLTMVADSRPAYMVTLERPVEYLLRHGQGLVHQREVGTDTQSFESGLRTAARQAAEVIMLSELDAQLTEAALEIAAGGCLVLAAVPGRGPQDALARLLCSQAAAGREHVRSLLGAALRGVIYQQLVPDASETAMQAAFAVLTAGEAVREHLEAEQWDALTAKLAAGVLPGSLPLGQSLYQLASAGHISDASYARHMGANG